MDAGLDGRERTVAALRRCSTGTDLGEAGEARHLEPPALVIREMQVQTLRW